MKSNLVIGIDVSKSTLDYLVLKGGVSWELVRKYAVKKLTNDVESIKAFLEEFDPNETLFVFEPTGTYSDKLMCLLITMGFQFSLVSPMKAHYFGKLQGISNKNDKQAARMLAYMGISQELPLYKVPSVQTKQRKQVITALNGLEKQKQMICNQIHAQEQYYEPNETVLTSLTNVLDTLQAEIESLKNSFEQIEDEAFKEIKRLATSVVGIGPISAHWLLITTDNFTNFDNPRKVLKFCGLTPGSHESGTSVKKKEGISKQTGHKLRGTLFMAARSAIRYNHACKDLYTRLRARGKSYYKAMVAVMAKLVKQVFGVVKSCKDFDNDYYLRYRKNPKKLA